MDLNKKIFKEVLIELATSKIHGIGVFAARKIKKRQFIAEGIHKEDYKDLVSWEEVKYANKDIKKTVQKCSDARRAKTEPRGVYGYTLSGAVCSATQQMSVFQQLCICSVH
jgi:hypothetical protein